MKYRYVSIAVFAFALGVLIRDQAQDYTPRAVSCQRAKDNADLFSLALAAALNGGAFQTNDVRVSCRVSPIRKEFL